MSMNQLRELREGGGRWQTATSEKPISSSLRLIHVDYANTILSNNKRMIERPRSGSRPTSANKTMPKLLI